MLNGLFPLLHKNAYLNGFLGLLSIKNIIQNSVKLKIDEPSTSARIPF